MFLVNIMNITTNVRYAVRVMLDLAQHNEITPVSSNDIAKRQETSKSYVDNLLNSLKTAGLVQAIRGAGGGFTLNLTCPHI